MLPPHLPPPPPGRTFLLALGKAAIGMAAAAEAHWPGSLSGLAVAPHGSRGSLRRVEIITADHPVPGPDSLVAARRLLALASEAGADDLVLLLLSGGASSLACLPGEGLSLEEKAGLTAALLRSGASIREINTVRRHISRFKGGRLALAAAPARLATLAISDVVGDRPEDIGSGPTVAGPSTVEEARAILERRSIAPPERGWSETPARVPGDYRIVARGSDAVAAAAAEAERLGYRAVRLECGGEARGVGREHAALALAAAPGTAIVSGGELTVTVRGGGTGGPNQEYALAARLGLAGRPDIRGLAADTDGIDGSSHAAGAFFEGGDSPGAEAALEANDSTAWFARRGDLFVTGPTGTNVNDLRILLVPPQSMAGLHGSAHPE